jgi:hypothetical protein
MVLRQPVAMTVQGVESAGGDDPGLAHGSAQAPPDTPRLFHEVRWAGQG